MRPLSESIRELRNILEDDRVDDHEKPELSVVLAELHAQLLNGYDGEFSLELFAIMSNEMRRLALVGLLFIINDADFLR